jgi:hypothetical protein
LLPQEILRAITGGAQLAFSQVVSGINAVVIQKGKEMQLIEPIAQALAQQSLNAGLQAAQNSTALLLEEAARMNGGRSAKRLKKRVRS